LLDIVLAASERNWRLFMLRKADKRFGKFQEKVFTDDGYTCRYCGFASKKHMSVVNIDGNYTNNKRSNMATCCQLCLQCFFIESVGQSDFGGGSLILLPEISQSQLNAMCHYLFAQMALSTSELSSAKNVYRSLKLRSQLIEKQLGEGMSNPALYGRVLVETESPEAKDLHKELVQHVRLLPAVEKFSNQIQQWVLAAIKTME
jgi:intracellular multiplication protein IcmJ